MQTAMFVWYWRAARRLARVLQNVRAQTSRCARAVAAAGALARVIRPTDNDAKLFFHQVRVQKVSRPSHRATVSATTRKMRRTAHAGRALNSTPNDSQQIRTVTSIQQRRTTVVSEHSLWLVFCARCAHLHIARHHVQSNKAHVTNRRRMRVTKTVQMKTRRHSPLHRP